jgi:hypothetical protein
MKAYTNSPDTRIALLEQSIVNINETLKRLETKIDNNHKETKEDISKLYLTTWSQFRWILGIIGTMLALPVIQNIITHFWSH